MLSLALNPTYAMTILSCDCNVERACSMHADDLYGRPDTTDVELLEENRQFLDATADFYIPGWTPDDEDEREHDRKILADMADEEEGVEAMNNALLKREAKGWF